MNSNADTCKTVVVGLGLTGLSCVRYLLAKKQQFTVADSRINPPGLEELSRLAPQIQVTTGEFSQEQFLDADRLILSPGVDPRNPAISEAGKQGVNLSGDVDLFSKEVAGPVVAVTGSNAKSTVVSLLGEMAREAGIDVVVAGNIGLPVLDLLQLPVKALYVLELSSFQLETTENLGAEVAAILNISHDHMDRYNSMDDYVTAKRRIFNGASKVVVHRGDQLTYPENKFDGEIMTWGESEPGPDQFGLRIEDGVEYLARGNDKLMPLSDMKLAGRHNVANALAALALGEGVGLPVVAMTEALKSFSGLPHRCQWVASVNGAEFYNDSKGTNPGACLAAIEGLSERGQIILMLGGQGKGADFSVLRDAIEAHVKLVVVFGEDARLIEKALGNVAVIRRANTFESAFKVAAGAVEPGDMVLLSPACASFDMFSSYQDRGETFTRLVQELST